MKAATGVLDVTVVLLEDGYASTAIGPIEVFHSAGVLWNWLHGEAQQPRFRVRIASIDGAQVNSLCSLGLTPDARSSDIEQTDIVILPASGWDVQDRIARNTALLPWLRKWHARGAYIAGICIGRRLPCRMRTARRPAGDHPLGAWPTSCASAIPRFAGGPSSS